MILFKQIQFQSKRIKDQMFVVSGGLVEHTDVNRIAAGLDNNILEISEFAQKMSYAASTNEARQIDSTGYM